MERISFGVFQSLMSYVAQAELADRSGDNGRSGMLLEDAQALIEANGLGKYVGIQRISFNSGIVLRLRRPDGYGISYTIDPGGIIFP